MTISTRAYFYLIDQVAIFQKELPAAIKFTEEQITSKNDNDDVYYQCGDAAICAMLKQRYKGIKNVALQVIQGIVCLLKFVYFKPWTFKICQHIRSIGIKATSK